jgi:hypothetical protein
LKFPRSWALAALAISFVTIGSARAQTSSYKFAFVTDLHYQRESYALSRQRFEFLVSEMNAWNPSFVVQNGDLIQGWSTRDGNLADIVSADSILDYITAPRYNVIGNHELDTNMSLEDVMAALGMDSTYYSFDRGGYHFIVLNAAYGIYGSPSNWHQGFIPPTEEAWLVNDLSETDKYTVVFIHHNLDGQAGFDTTKYVYQRKHIRNILENSGKVIAVLQGHLHLTYQWIHGGVSYFEIIKAGYQDVANYAKVKLYPDTHLIKITIQPDYYQMTYTYGPRPPLPFDLAYPPDGIVISSNQDTLRWHPAMDLDPGTVTYDVYYDTDSLFSNPVLASGVADTFWAMGSPLASNTEFYWKVIAKDTNGLATPSNSVYSFSTPPDTVVSSVIPDRSLATAMISAYPNPFSSEVTLRYFTPAPGAAVRIYDVKGRLVAVVADRLDETGWGTLRWNGRGENGLPVGSGVYFGVIERHGLRRSCKLILMR